MQCNYSVFHVHFSVTFSRFLLTSSIRFPWKGIYIFNYLVGQTVLVVHLSGIMLIVWKFCFNNPNSPIVSQFGTSKRNSSRVSETLTFTKVRLDQKCSIATIFGPELPNLHLPESHEKKTYSSLCSLFQTDTTLQAYHYHGKCSDELYSLFSPVHIFTTKAHFHRVESSSFSPCSKCKKISLRAPPNKELLICG